MGTPSMETPGLEDDVFFTNGTSSPFFWTRKPVAGWLSGLFCLTFQTFARCPYQEISRMTIPGMLVPSILSPTQVRSFSVIVLQCDQRLNDFEVSNRPA